LGIVALLKGIHWTRPPVTARRPNSGRLEPYRDYGREGR
jgi:hypothetical protein